MHAPSGFEVSVWPTEVLRPRSDKFGTTASHELWAVLVTFDGRCAYCSDGAVEVWDHLMPRRLRGPTSHTNLVPACRRCNSRKGGKHPLEWPPSRQVVELYVLWSAAR